MTVESTRSSSSTEHPAGCLLRLFWLLFGNVLLVLAAALILRDSGGWALLWADALYAVTLVGLVVARYLDVLRFAGQTADGTPASPAHFRRYALLVVVVASALWGAAHAVSATLGR